MVVVMLVPCAFKQYKLQGLYVYSFCLYFMLSFMKVLNFEKFSLSVMKVHNYLFLMLLLF